MDPIFPSGGIYKVNVEVNDTMLDDCSFISSTDKIRPFFDESISKDPDVTGLIIFIKDSGGELSGSRVTYSLDSTELSQQEAGDGAVVFVKSLDNALPYYLLPKDLYEGSYTIVSQVMSGNEILQRTEKTFYYLGEARFSYEGINVHLPGIAENFQHIPRETTVMLEVDLAFSNDLSPYVIWYDGRKKISEGRISDGAGQLFWKAPEQSGFFSIRAEVFPVRNSGKLAGYSKEVSMLVSSKMNNVHMVSENIPQLISWYTFDGNLNNAKASSSSGSNIARSPVWKSSNGTYGLSTGYNNIINLSKVPVPDNEEKTWQVLFRFIPVNNGGVFSILLDSSRHVYLHLFMEDRNIILTLTSPQRTVSQVYRLPETNEASVKSFFHVVGVSFSIRHGLLSANINYADNLVYNEPLVLPVSFDTNTQKEFQITLGSINGNIIPNDSRGVMPESTVIWDEFALYFLPPPIDILTAKVVLRAREEAPAETL